MSLYESLLARRDAERVRRAEALLVVEGDAQPWEDTPQGRLRWYLHPDLTARALQTMGLYMQEIPPHSRHHNPHDEPARFVCAWPNFPAVLGVDMGAGLEQLEAAPDPGAGGCPPDRRSAQGQRR